MTTISELLATKQSLTIAVNGKTYEHPLLEPVTIKIENGYELTVIDDFEIKDWWGYMRDGDWYFDTKYPFYQWKHTITDQGWLFYQNPLK